MAKQQTKIFYDNDLATALDNCQKEGYRALFMDELADARIKAGKDSEPWQKWYSTPSLRATGKTKQSNAVVVYAHVPNHFSNPENIKNAVEEGLSNGAGNLPEKEFYRLLDLEDGKKVFIVDYNKLKNSKSGVISVDSALEHPQTIPFLGGEKRAEQYLARHKQVYGDKIGIWHSDDLSENPAGRLLFLGIDFNDDLLDGCNLLNSDGRFFGVQSTKSAEGDTKKIGTPNLNKILKYSRIFVPKFAQPEYEKGLRELLQ